MASPNLTGVFFCPQDYVDAPLSIPEFLTCSLNIDWSQYQVRGLIRAGQNKGRAKGMLGASPSCRYLKAGWCPTILPCLGKEELLIILLSRFALGPENLSFLNVTQTFVSTRGFCFQRILWCLFFSSGL